MHHIIQENCFNEKSYDKFIDIFKRNNISHEIIRVKPFVDDIDFNYKGKDVMVWGAIKLARIGKKYDWYPSSFMNEKHDYDYYSKYLGKHLFNADSKIYKYSEIKNVDLPETFFARPTKDSKSFSGAVFYKEDFLTTMGVMERNDWVKEDFNIQIADVKKVHLETRFWVVKGKVITGSTYKVGSSFVTEEILNDSPIWKFAENMLDLVNIADAFVIDICHSDDGFSVMELGCINCAGFYDANMSKVVQEIEKEFNNEIINNLKSE